MKEKSEREVAQSCPTLSDPMDCSPPGSSVHGFSRQEYWRGCHCLLHTKCLANGNTAERRLNPHGNIKLRGMKSALTQFSTSVLSMPVENVLVANVVQ